MKVDVRAKRISLRPPVLVEERDWKSVFREAFRDSFTVVGSDPIGCLAMDYYQLHQDDCSHELAKYIVKSAAAQVARAHQMSRTLIVKVQMPASRKKRRKTA